MDTRTIIYVLVDHKEYYGTDRPFDDIHGLLKEISTASLLNHVAWINRQLYLAENDDRPGKIQARIVGSLLREMSTDDNQRWITFVQEQATKSQNPMLSWNYSNILFLDYILNNVNDKPKAKFTLEESRNVFDALLTINSHANSRISIDAEELTKILPHKNALNSLLIANFIYQKDFESSSDFSNQVQRGKMLFEFLESHDKYQNHVHDFYKMKGVSGYKEMFKTLLSIFMQLGIESDNPQHLISLQTTHEEQDVNLTYIESLCVNSSDQPYQTDESFKVLRDKFLYRIDEYRFFVLNVNFLFDHFYKNQIFGFNAFLESKYGKSDFFSIKAKEFMEEIYFVSLLNRCFPQYVNFFGKKCENSKGEELCDGYVRKGNKILIIEFKDILLNAAAKNSADVSKLFRELDKKFKANEKGKKKGATQLLDAVEDIENHLVKFDDLIGYKTVELFPVILYTDNSFGAPGINAYFAKYFSEEIQKQTRKNVVQPLVFINLSFFETRQDYLSENLIDIFDLLTDYSKHVSNPDFERTTFEVYEKFKSNEENVPILGNPKVFTSVLEGLLY